MGDLGLPGSVVEMPEPKAQSELWEVRKAGLNIMMSMRGDGKPVSFIEDCAVPLEHLADYTQRLTEVFSRHGTKGTWYAHASVGTLHVRPILDMRRDGAAKMRAIAERRRPWCAPTRRLFGRAWRRAGALGVGGLAVRAAPHPGVEEVKDLFDPKGLLNPGKIVRPPRMDQRELFRFGPDYRVLDHKPALDWSAWDVQATR